MSKLNLTLGADPELFLVDAQNAFVSAVGLIGGTKQQPLPLPIGEGFAVQEDNVAVEYNIPPSASREEFNNNINSAMQCLTERIAGLGLRFSDVSAVAFPEMQLNDPRALEFGCDPDFNAWKDGAQNPRPKATDWRLRSCGGHVHIGYSFDSQAAVCSFIRHLDLYLSVPAVLMDEGNLRKQLYGKPGAFRYKPYGCEYRSLSNFWTLTSKTRDWVWDSIELAMDAWQNKKIDIDSERKAILSAINKNNKELAQGLINKYNLLVV